MQELLKFKVKPDADEVVMEQLKENEYRVSLTEPAREGRANRQLIAVLSEYFARPESSFQIVRGHHDRSKYVRVHQ